MTEEPSCVWPAEWLTFSGVPEERLAEVYSVLVQHVHHMGRDRDKYYQVRRLCKYYQVRGRCKYYLISFSTSKSKNCAPNKVCSFDIWR